MTPLRLFRAAAVAEAVTWTALIAGLVLRATLGLDVAVTIAGGVHGFVFLAYAAVAVIVAVNQRWSPRTAVLAVASAVVPYATVPLELWAARTGRLAGPWLRDRTADRHWLDGLVRWAVGRPVLLTVLVTVGVVTLFVVLVALGPPTLPGA